MPESVVLAAPSLRASNYTIYVDLEDDPEHVLLVHGYSGAYDRVTNEVAAFVRSLDHRPPKPLYGTWSDEPVVGGTPAAPSDATIELLAKRGYLTNLTRAEERTRFDRVARAKHGLDIAKMPAYIIMPTYDCNLRCAYCFQDHMRTNAGFRHLLRTVTPATIDRLVAAMPGIEERHGITAETRRPRSITFFGGEPLLAQSRRVIDYFMTSIRAIGDATFAAVSNATELDAYADVLGPDGISVIQITLDGPRERHDQRRIYEDGGGSFDRIVRNIDLALERGVHVDLRMNVDRTNIGTLPELAAFFAQRGWARSASFTAYAAPVQATNEHTERKTCFNSHELGEALKALRSEHPEMQAITTTDDSLRLLVRSMLRRRGDPLPMMRASYCGAHNSMYVFDAFGDIYACWERTGDKNIRIGWIGEDGRAEFVEDRLKSWRARNVTSNETCAQCRYAMYCGGGCAVLAEDVHGTMFGNYCDAFGRRFRLSVRDAFRERDAAPQADERVLELRSL
jgi:uncharacterized protein